MNVQHWTPDAPAAARLGNAPGPRIYNLFPLLAGRVSDWTRELPRIAAMGFDWVYLNPFHAAGFSGSLYAVKDFWKLDPRFADNGDDRLDALAPFLAEARRLGLRVMADLVVNHTSKDALLTREHPEVYRRDEKGELESPYAVDPVDPSIKTVWGDLAELDWHSDRSVGVLLPYFDRLIAELQRLGFAGFRCDAAYKVPAHAWRTLISDAKEREPSALFAAETLGCTFEETRAIAEAGFDYLFNSFAWWDGKAPWLLDQYEELRLEAPSIAFPENHDMPRLAAEIDARTPAETADRLRARYALAAAFSAGVLMPMGYEWGYRKPLHVVETTPGDREDTGIDISEQIAAINRMRAELPPLNMEGAQHRLSAPDAPVLALVRYDAGHATAARYATLVLANLTEEPQSLDAGPLLARAGGLFGRFSDLTAFDAGPPLVPGEPLTLAPSEVRLYAAARSVERLEVQEPEPDGAGRVVVENVEPQLDGGATPIKRVVGDRIEVSADIFTDGHEKIRADLLWRCCDEAEWRRTPMKFVENDRWAGSFPLERIGRHAYTIEAWRDPWASWLDEVTKKRDAGVNIQSETLEGVTLARAAAERAEGGPDEAALAALLAEIEAAQAGSLAQTDLLTGAEARRLVARHAPRHNLSSLREPLSVIADRLAARFSAWYELFPRSASGDPSRHGTFDDVIARLPYVRAMGFDVLYFPPIHPIGHKNRKGKNNSLKAEPGDVGSVYAVGAPEGGHDALHPQLGTLEDFRRLVAEAEKHGLEIALDFAIQCSPDHPWIKEHPEWFDWRPDGTLKYAENPPKKYEDIVNVEFYGKSQPALWYALRDVVMFWVRQGVRIFRVDNPHTKPLPFWRWLIRSITDTHPDVLFLAEAFTRPKMMRALAKAGFQQSYTYFTWRNTKFELRSYAEELAGDLGEVYRPNFFVNTPDINPHYLQTSGRPGHIVRATLAATLAGAWGVYSGFELCEATPLPGREEYLDSEKYEIRAWDFDRPGNIRAHITALNTIRRQNPAFTDFRNIEFLNAWNDSILAYVKATPTLDNVVMVMVNLDPHNRHEADYELPLWRFGLPDSAALDVHDLLRDERFSLTGKVHRIALDPQVNPVQIWRLARPG